MSTWVGHEVVDNATIGRLDTLVDQFENLDPEDRDRAWLAEDAARQARGNLKYAARQMEKAQERVKGKWREMMETRHDLEAALIANGNAEELTDKLQDAGTYILGVVSLKFIVAGATVALVAGTTITLAGKVIDATRAEGEENVLRGAAENVADVVGTGNDVLAVAEAANVTGAKAAGGAFGGALTVASAAGDAWEAFHSEPVVARLDGSSAEAFADLRGQIERQSAFANKGELRYQATRAENAQNAYNRAVQDLNRKTIAYARALAAAQEVTWSKPK